MNEFFENWWMRFALGGGCACVSLLIAIAARRQLGEAQRMMRRLPPWQRAAMACLLAVCLAYGGTKTNQVDRVDVGLGLRSRSTMEDNILCTTTTSDYDYHPPAVTPEDIARGWQVWEVRTNAAVDYAMPAGAVLASNWWMRGAYEDVVRIGNGDRGTGIGEWLFPFGTNEYSSLWAFSWGKARFALASTNTEIVAVGAPMSAVPYRSRLWSAADADGSRLVTWENFALNRDTNTPVNAQIELRATGDFVTRSNEVETVCRRVDPEDWDGDGIPNDRDCRPYACDGDFFGPRQSLPEGANADAYCWIEVAADANARVVFTGDGRSVLPDPDFMVRAGETYRVRLLIGKTYAVRSTRPLEVVGRSDERVEVSNVGLDFFTVVWPVVISDEPILEPGPRLLLGSGSSLPKGDGRFSLWVAPSWLNGVVNWSTSNCCHVAVDGWPFDFVCGSADCGCGGCNLSGSYIYEGYTIYFSGIRCGCHYEPHNQTTFGLALPSVVFKDGALMPMSVNFHHGDADEREAGTLTLSQTAGLSRIRVWEDADKTHEVSGNRSWDVSSFEGVTFYIEGVETSAGVEDITFRLVWNRPGGTLVEDTGKMTCAEVEKVNVESSVCGASANPPPFAGQMPHGFNVTHSPNPDQHAVVFFKDVVDSDLTVQDFSVWISLSLKPVGVESIVGSANWFKLPPSPSSGTLSPATPSIGRLMNPKEGGVYHIAAAFSGSATNECNIVLPLSGASVDNVLRSDLARADVFARKACAKYTLRERNSVRFGHRWLVKGGNGDYLGRANNASHQTVWYYNQVRDSDGQGARCTLKGVPIRNAKLSNLVAAYLCARLGVSTARQAVSQLIGKKNGISASLSWDCGIQLANGADFDQTVSSMVLECWFEGEDRVIKLWPNLAPADDWNPRPFYTNWNRQFYSPGFLSQDP